MYFLIKHGPFLVIAKRATEQIDCVHLLNWALYKLKCLHSLLPPCCSQTGLQPHHRRGVWFPSCQCWWKDGQAADLGHCWAGAIPVTACVVFAKL